MTSNGKTPQIQLSPNEKREILFVLIEARDKDGIHLWIEQNFGVKIPRIAITSDHDAPFDFVCEYLFGEFQTAIVLANRSGGKTYDFAILDAIVSFLIPVIEVATVGAIKAQALRCYGYFSGYIKKEPFASNVQSETMAKTKLVNGSSVEVVTGTITGVNSPHPQAVFIDEIDLMPWQILQQAFSMPQSKNGILARTVLTSTRKFPNASMQRMLDEAEKNDARVYKWNIWEVIEKLPTHDPVLMAKIKKVFGNELPANIHLANGYYKWEDAIVNRLRLDDDTWESEWLCSKPGSEGLIYGKSYSDERNMIMDFDPRKVKLGQFWLFEDFGYGKNHPDVVLFTWLAPDYSELVIFGELYMHEMGTDEIWNEVVDKLTTHGLKVSDVLWVPDYHGLTHIADRQQRGATMVEKGEKAEDYLVANGIAMIKNLFEKGLIKITPDCPELRGELLSYSKKKNADGTFSKDPQKKNDHGPDALHYGVVQVYPLLIGYLLAKMGENDPAPGESSPDKGRSLTSGLYGKVF